MALGAAAMTAIGIGSASIVARDVGAYDPQIVVIDEVAGMLVTMIPCASFSMGAAAVGFVLFRMLDAFKPWLRAPSLGTGHRDGRRGSRGDRSGGDAGAPPRRGADLGYTPTSGLSHLGSQARTRDPIGRPPGAEPLASEAGAPVARRVALAAGPFVTSRAVAAPGATAVRCECGLRHVQSRSKLMLHLFMCRDR